MNVIDSKSLERDAGGKPVSTFPHPALSRPAEIGQHWLFVIRFADLIRRVDHGVQISFDGECWAASWP
jgi:hypothetical protein